RFDGDPLGEPEPLLHHRESIILRDDPIGLRVLVVPGDGEALGLAANGLVFVAAEVDRARATVIAALADERLDRVSRVEAIGGLLDPFVPGPTLDLGAHFSFEPIVHGRRRPPFGVFARRRDGGHPLACYERFPWTAHHGGMSQDGAQAASVGGRNVRPKTKSRHAASIWRTSAGLWGRPRCGRGLRPPS